MVDAVTRKSSIADIIQGDSSERSDHLVYLVSYKVVVGIDIIALLHLRRTPSAQNKKCPVPGLEAQILVVAGKSRCNGIIPAYTMVVSPQKPGTENWINLPASLL